MWKWKNANLLQLKRLNVPLALRSAIRMKI